ncbi:MAG: hypothetical protein LBF86_00805, partial [Helicobacteraceae bacterium]|nr:hypothetical protein [Helicobacteraceae bacterium]
MTFSILAFEGEFFIGRGSGGGHDKAIVKKLKQNDEYITLTNKQSKAESGALSAKAFSDTDESRLKRLEDQV